jgi:Ni/Fe-hydrogenase subunit HybB-like protein
MEWIPIVFVIFKALVLGTGMFFAIKWHYDQGKKGNVQQRRAVLRATGKVIVIFVLALAALGLFTYFLVRETGLNLS